jgi:hypothetical protein
MISVSALNAYYSYGGSNIFTAAASQIVSLNYVGNGGKIIGTVFSNYTLTNAENKYTIRPGAAAGLSDVVTGLIDNQPITLCNDVATEISGNAANDNTITVLLAYVIIDFN